MDNKTTISFNSQNNDVLTGGAQTRLRPSLDSFFLLSVCPVCLQKSSSVPSVFLGLKGEKRGEKGRKGTNALCYYGMREATNLPFVCPVCLQKSSSVPSVPLNPAMG